MIVVDVGAMRQGPEESTLKLVERFQPQVLFGFDPHPDFVEGVATIDGTVVVNRRVAAWTHGGAVRFVEDGICSGVEQDRSETRRSLRTRRSKDVECFILAFLLRTLPAGVVLKLDCEGAEYPLLSQIAATRADERLALVLVEWHPEETAHGHFMAERPTLRCPVEEWA